LKRDASTAEAHVAAAAANVVFGAVCPGLRRVVVVHDIDIRARIFGGVWEVVQINFFIVVDCDRVSDCRSLRDLNLVLGCHSKGTTNRA
jgi:hypothetical protein